MSEHYFDDDYMAGTCNTEKEERYKHTLLTHSDSISKENKKRFFLSEQTRRHMKITMHG